MHALAGANWLDPQWLLNHFGSQFFWVSVIIVFVECGLLFPILPGDTLLFGIGLFVANGALKLNLVLALVVLCVAAFAGNVAGYEIGRAVGVRLAEHDGRIVKKKYFDQTHAFFEKHGNKALVIGRFVPFVRTYVTVVAGIGRMDRRRFFTWSAVGSVLWVCIVTLLGYFLGQAFPPLKDHLELAILVVVALSLVPVAVEYLRHRHTSRAAVSESDEILDEVRDHR